jgi:hypothetical protein
MFPLSSGAIRTDRHRSFVFKNVIPGIKGYERLVGTIDWLRAAGLIIRLPIVTIWPAGAKGVLRSSSSAKWMA